MEVSYTRPITLGFFISKLRSLPQDEFITFDFGGLAPDQFYSWRGNHSHLALSYQMDRKVTIASLLTEAEDAYNRLFVGYKGGEYRASEKTPLWADNKWLATCTAIVDVVAYRWQANKIITRYIPYESLY